MRSYQPIFHDGFEAMTPEPLVQTDPPQPDITSRETAAASDDALRIRYVELLQNHHDLDDTVARLSEAATFDELLVARLKKRKLQIKDAIARLEDLLGSQGQREDLPA